MRIAGFDPGLKTGWAVYDSELAPHWWWGVFELSYEHPLTDLHQKLKLLAHPHSTWIEKPVGLGYNAMGPNSQKVGIIMLWAGEEQTRLIQPNTVKKAATGSGKAKKNDMIAHARRRWGNGVTIEHEADALWVCEYGRKQLGW